ncbi:DUF2321 domain-containing protein [Bacillus pseudomycoides]|uniref:DUF2321 domain-containing protein n=1 Tax=Bacillus pseudomycoides TaxID=64104 RepID=UPI000BF55F58|nr:DUF2321 domain-containing protein [Bacillus pseudomycoides]PEP86081.1 hypothetical protein CN584_08465 [Bacillus pseudomycoides]PHE19195.1 hypothetical protein COF59_08175 [Bacillus pseudomycoides]
MNSDKTWYDIAQICLNGHIINDTYKKYPESDQAFCKDCGEKNITTCQDCNADIRGARHLDGFGTDLQVDTAPNYCSHCGEPYPWTKIALEAAKELAQEVEGLTTEEKELLSKSIDEIVKGGPKTVVATTRFKKIATKFGAGIGNAFRDILVDVASESAKKILWP